MTNQRNANGGKQTYYYDANGNIKKITDHAGHDTVMAYTARDQLESIRQNGEVVTYKYDSLGRIASVEDAEANITEYENNNTRERVLRILAIVNTQWRPS